MGWQQHRAEDEGTSSGFSFRAGYLHHQQRQQQSFEGGTRRLDGGEVEEEDGDSELGEEDKKIPVSYNIYAYSHSHLLLCTGGQRVRRRGAGRGTEARGACGV
jgi:hypothetical protein